MPIPLYPIVTYPAAVLAQTTAPVTTFDKSLDRIIKRMVPTMYEADGIGLAANQVGLSVALAVIHYEPRDEVRKGKQSRLDQPVPLHAIINPVITHRSDEQDEMNEGCLSCPGIEVAVRRSTQIVVEYQRPDGSPITKTISGFAARIYQHEIDHLNGFVILDRAHGQKALIEAYRANPTSFIQRS